MKMAVFRDVASYSLVDVDHISEELTASIIRPDSYLHRLRVFEC
jgi:hypothetical protein